MDRHAVKGATSKTVADAHQKDLKLQDRFDVRVMTYWFDQDRGSSFCLMDSPARENVRQLHASRIERDAPAVRENRWGIDDCRSTGTCLAGLAERGMIVR
jgi:hypothetical protein